MEAVPILEHPRSRKATASSQVRMPPAALTPIRPWTAPSRDERDRGVIVASGTPGQNVIMRVAMTPYKDLGNGMFEVSDLAGQAGRIPSQAVKGHFENYRFTSRGVAEMVLLPAAALRVEKGITQSFWMRMTVPEDAQPGMYKGSVTFRSERSPSSSIPVELEVYPFRLEPVLPVSFGVYGGDRVLPDPGGEAEGVPSTGQVGGKDGRKDQGPAGQYPVTTPSEASLVNRALRAS